MIRFIDGVLLIDVASLRAGNWPRVNDPPWQISEIHFPQIDRHLGCSGDRSTAPECEGKIIFEGLEIPVTVRAVPDSAPTTYCRYFAFPASEAKWRRR